MIITYFFAFYWVGEHKAGVEKYRKTDSIALFFSFFPHDYEAVIFPVLSVQFEFKEK